MGLTGTRCQFASENEQDSNEFLLPCQKAAEPVCGSSIDQCLALPMCRLLMVEYHFLLPTERVRRFLYRD